MKTIAQHWLALTNIILLVSGFVSSGYMLKFRLDLNDREHAQIVKRLENIEIEAAKLRAGVVRLSDKLSLPPPL